MLLRSSMRKFSEFHKILGVSPAASLKDVKLAYLKLAKQLHPDSPTGDAEKFRTINHAYESIKSGAATAPKPKPQAKRNSQDFHSGDFKTDSKFH